MRHAHILSHVSPSKLLSLDSKAHVLGPQSAGAWEHYNVFVPSLHVSNLLIHLYYMDCFSELKAALEYLNEAQDRTPVHLARPDLLGCTNQLRPHSSSLPTSAPYVDIGGCRALSH